MTSINQGGGISLSILHVPCGIQRVAFSMWHLACTI